MVCIQWLHSKQHLSSRISMSFSNYTACCVAFPPIHIFRLHFIAVSKYEAFRLPPKHAPFADRLQCVLRKLKKNDVSYSLPSSNTGAPRTQGGTTNYMLLHARDAHRIWLISHFLFPPKHVLKGTVHSDQKSEHQYARIVQISIHIYVFFLLLGESILMTLMTTFKTSHQT